MRGGDGVWISAKVGLTIDITTRIAEKVGPMIEKTTGIAAQGGAMIKIPLLLPLWASLLSDARERERENGL